MFQSADKTMKWFVDSEGKITEAEAWTGGFMYDFTKHETEREAREQALRLTSDLRDKYANIAVTHAQWIQADNKRIEEEKKRFKVGDRVRDDEGDTGTVVYISERAKEIVVEIDDPYPWTYGYSMLDNTLEKIED